MEQGEGIIKGEEVEISKEARNKLELWGIESDEINKIDSIIGSSEYGNCLKKAKRIVEQSNFQTSDFVIIPDSHNPINRDEGVCQDLSNRLLIELSNSSLLQRLVSKGINFRVSHGKSKKHFNSDVTTHVWVELMKDGGEQDVVILDPSFKSIEMFPESGYQRSQNSSEKINPKEVFGFSAEEVRIIDLQELINYNQTLKERAPYKVLGRSTSGKSIFNIGFLSKSQPDSSPRPYLTLTFEDRNDYPVSLGIEDNNVTALTGDITKIDLSDLKEAEGVLITLQKVKVIDDKIKADKYDHLSYKQALKF